MEGRDAGAAPQSGDSPLSIVSSEKMGVRCYLSGGWGYMERVRGQCPLEEPVCKHLPLLHSCHRTARGLLHSWPAVIKRLLS